MKKCSLYSLAMALGFLTLAGCEAGIGDKCSSSNDCPIGVICDTYSPGGYCLTYNCESNEECPENGVCVKFTTSLHYCLKSCKINSDCRSGYVCRDDVGEDAFCYVASEGPYGRDPDNEIKD